MEKYSKWIIGGSLFLLAVVSINGPLGMTYSTGDPPRGIRTLNFFINLLSPIAGPKTFFYLMSFFTAVWALITFGQKPKSSPGTNESLAQPAISAADKKMVADMLEGVVAQVQHGRSLEELSKDQPFHVRLMPQVPIRSQSSSWLGGQPYMPESMAWPIDDDGNPMAFIAQLDLAQMPAEIWEGLGPRQGWLLFFSGYDCGDIHLVHTPELGSVHRRPSLPESRTSKYAHWFYHGVDVYDDMPSAIREQPHWPVDIVPVAAGSNSEDWDYGFAHSTDANPSPGTERYTDQFDIREPRFLPFDWHSLWCLVRASREAIRYPMKSARDTIKYTPGPVQKLQQDRPEGFETSIQNAQKKVQTAETRLAELQKVEAQIEALEQQVVAARQAQTPFSQTERDRIMLALTELDMRGYNTYNPEDPNRLGYVSGPQSSGWLNTYTALFLDYAKHLYVSTPQILPKAVKDELERDLQFRAPREYGLSGHYPVGYVHEYEETTDITLLQLPTSDLMKWMWGDMYDLVLTIKKSDLAKGDFSKVYMQITN